MMGNGDGTFRSPVFYATGDLPENVLAVDLNHDGILDLAVACQGTLLLSDPGIGILLGNADGTFRPGSFIKQPDSSLNVHNSPYGLAAADFDGDGNTDLLVQAVNDHLTVVLYGTGPAQSHATPLLTT